MLLSFSGCAIPCLRGAKPGPDLPENYNCAVCFDNSAQVGVSEFFGDPVLTQLIAEGMAGNQELRIRNEEIQIANNEIMSRRGVYLPFVTLNAEGGFERNSKFMPLGAAEEELPYRGGGEFPDPLPNVRISTNLFWRIDVWREFRNAKDAAIQRYFEAIEERNYFVTRLVAEIARNYYELAALDQRLVFLNQTIEIQEKSLEVARAQKAAARGTELAVQRFLAEVRKNESERLIVRQDIIETENRINFLVGRYPQPFERVSWDVISLDSRLLCVGVPAQILQNRRDIRAAERELAASGLDVLVARARFYPRVELTAGVGFEAFSPRYLFDPGALIGHAIGELVAPLINKSAIRAEYLTANARQLQAVYNYQRVILDAFTEVVNFISKVENYRTSVAIRQKQVEALEESVDVATSLFQNARAEYVDVLLSQRDLLEARVVLIETKKQQLTAIVSAYQALGGGYLLSSSGVELIELFCHPFQIQIDAVIAPHILLDAEELTDSENLPLPSTDENAPSANADPMGEPVPGQADPKRLPDPIELPVPGAVNLQSASGKPGRIAHFPYSTETLSSSLTFEPLYQAASVLSFQAPALERTARETPPSPATTFSRIPGARELHARIKY